jgi:putative membrane protein
MPTNKLQNIQTSSAVQKAIDVVQTNSDAFCDRLSGNLLSALVFSAVGLVAFGVAFWIFDAITPKVSVWKELVDKQNTAVALFLAAIIIGMSMIISAAIHG